MATGTRMPERILQPYREWREKAIAFGDACAEFERIAPDAEDLGDWVQGIHTILTFSPEVPPAPEDES